LATPEAFFNNPKLVWDWYNWRRSMISEAAPNPAHTALVKFEERIQSFSLITQNVDGLHDRAGSRSVLELHGNINRARCTNDGRTYDNWTTDNHSIPRCPRCGELLRPDVVWFGEQLPVGVLAAAVETVRSAEIHFAVGTSSVIQPAASLTSEAKNCGAVVVEINLTPTPITPFVDYFLQGRAGQLLPNLYNGAFGNRGSHLY
jgi:NAD-dependent deacetylase